MIVYREPVIFFVRSAFPGGMYCRQLLVDACLQEEQAAVKTLGDDERDSEFLPKIGRQDDAALGINAVGVLPHEHPAAPPFRILSPLYDTIHHNPPLLSTVIAKTGIFFKKTHIRFSWYTMDEIFCKP